MSNVNRQYGISGLEKTEKDLDTLFDFLNSFTDVIEFTVATGGTEVEISHGLEHIPRQVFPVIVEGATTSFANVYAGTTAWTKSKVYLTASLAGNYYVILRR